MTNHSDQTMSRVLPDMHTSPWAFRWALARRHPWAALKHHARMAWMILTMSRRRRDILILRRCHWYGRKKLRALAKQKLAR